MRFTRWVFIVAGIYGLLILAPMLLMETQIGRDDPPTITHPEYFYGFLSVALAWQFAFLVIAVDPVRYRLMIIPAILEKFSFGTAVYVLLLTRGVPMPIVAGASVDLLLGALFVTCWLTTRPAGVRPD